MTWSPATKTKVLTACGRHCCICHKFAGLKIELHHIKLQSEGGDSSEENCIPLCLDCHADMSSYDKKHPKGTKYTEMELKAHRDTWYRRIANPALTTYGDNSRDLDTDLYRSLRARLPSAAVEFVRTHPFGTMFRSDSLNPIYDYATSRTRPDEEFIDPELESMRSDLKEKIEIFCEKISTNTWADDRNPDFCSVPREWKYANHEHYYDVIEHINTSARQVGLAFDSFTRTALRKLNIRILD